MVLELGLHAFGTLHLAGGSCVGGGAAPGDPSGQLPLVVNGRHIVIGLVLLPKGTVEWSAALTYRGRDSRSAGGPQKVSLPNTSPGVAFGCRATFFGLESHCGS